MSVEEIQFDAEERMEKAVSHLASELRGIRTGRAHPALVEHIKVDYYGTPTELRQLASIAVPEANMIVVRPFDASTAKAIERAIETSGIGITPMSDSRGTIRLPIPPLSEERRKQLVAQVKQITEQTRIAIRNIRRDANKQIDAEQKQKLITEDERDRAKEEIQEITKQYESKANDLLKAKTAEIMET